MSLRNPAYDIEESITLGMDSTSPAQAVPQGFVRLAKNCRPALVSGWIKRDGYTKAVTNAWGSRDINGGIEFSVSGTKRLIVYGVDATDGRYGYNNAGTITAITTGLSKTARPSFISFGSLLFFFNGTDAPEVYNGTAARQVGITAPTNVASGVQGTAGALVQTGTYIYTYTYYNSVTGAESSPAPLYTVTLTGANDDVTLTLTAGSATTADTIRIYRTVSSGNILFLEGTEVISATSHASTIADSALSSTQLELDNTRVTTWDSAPEFPAVAQRRIFVKTGNNEIRHSKIGQSGPMPESFEAKAVVDTTSKLGVADDIVGIAVAGDVPIVLKEKSVGSLRPLGIPIPGAFDQVVYEYQEITGAASPVGHFAAAEMNGLAVLLCKDNVYVTSGQPGDWRSVADAVQSTIQTFGFSASQCPKMSAVNDEKLKCVYFSVFEDSGDAAPSIVLVGDYQQFTKTGQFRWSLYTPGTSAVTHPGINAGCFIPVTNATDGSRDVYFGNIAANGKVYKMNDGTSDDTSGIYFEIISRPYSLGSPLLTKLFKNSLIYAEGDGADYDLSVASRYDLSSTDSNVTPINLFAGGAVFDTALFDEATFSTSDNRPKKYSQHRKANLQQLVFKQTDADAPITLHSWSTYGSLFGLV